MPGRELLRLVPTQRFAVHQRPWRSALAQAHWLKRLAAFDVICQGAAHLRDKSSLILGVAQGSRSKLGGPQIEVCAREFRVLTNRLAWSDRIITDHLGSRSALLEEFALLDDPAIPVHLDRLVFQLPLGVPRAPLYGNGVASAALQDDLIAHLRLRQ